jgi:hypothetical protein
LGKDDDVMVMDMAFSFFSPLSFWLTSKPVFAASTGFNIKQLKATLSKTTIRTQPAPITV